MEINENDLLSIAVQFCKEEQEEHDHADKPTAQLHIMGDAVELRELDCDDPDCNERHVGILLLAHQFDFAKDLVPEEDLAELGIDGEGDVVTFGRVDEEGAKLPDVPATDQQ